VVRFVWVIPGTNPRITTITILYRLHIPTTMLQLPNELRAMSSACQNAPKSTDFSALLTEDTRQNLQCPCRPIQLWASHCGTFGFRSAYAIVSTTILGYINALQSKVTQHSQLVLLACQLCCRQVLFLAVSVCPHKSRILLVGNSWNLVGLCPMVNARSGWKLVTFDLGLWPWELFSYFFIYYTYHSPLEVLNALI